MWHFGETNNPVFTNYDVMTLYNMDMLPMVIACACLTARFNWDRDDCIGEYWLKVAQDIPADGHSGAVFYYGASGARSSPPDDMLEGFIYLISKRYPGYSGVISPLLYVAWNDRIRFHEFLLYHMLGDPIIQLRTKKPKEILASHPNLIQPDEIFEVRVSSREFPGGIEEHCSNAVVCLWKEREFQLLGLTNEDGIARFETPFSNPGLVYITVKKYDHIPYEGEAHIPSDSLSKSGQSIGSEKIKRPVLYQNYPNPFKTLTKISFSIPSECFVSLIIYDVKGRKIRTLIKEKLKPGNYNLK